MASAVSENRKSGRWSSQTKPKDPSRLAFGHKYVALSPSSRVLFVPYTSLETTFRSFIPYWKRGVESVAYWFGKEFEIHTHPKQIATHSSYDDSHAISGRNGFLSLVVTHYGGVANFDLNQMSVHEAWDHEWVVLEDKAKIERIRIVYDFDARVSDLDE